MGLLTKMRIGSIKLRLSAQEIHLEWRDILESILLTTLSVILYMSVVLTQFSFVPIMILSIKRGWKETLAYITLASIFLIYLVLNSIVRFPLDNSVLLFSPVHYLFKYIGNSIGLKGVRFLDYYILYGGCGIFMGYLVAKNYRLNYVIYVSLGVYAGIIIFSFILTGFLGGITDFISDYSSFVEKKTDSFVNLYLSHIVRYKSLLDSRGLDYSLLEKRIQLSAKIFKDGIIFVVAPRGGYLIREVILLFLGTVFANLYFKKKLKRAAFRFNLRNYHIDDNYVWGLILAWGIVYINLWVKNDFVSIFSWNIAVIFSLLYFLKGLSIANMFFDRIKIPRIIQYALFFFFFVYSFIIFIVIVTGIGVADVWLKIQDKLKKSLRSNK